MTTKTMKVQKHLRTKKSITSLQAIDFFRATRLAAIIFNLRKAGWDIASERITKKQDGETLHYVKYKLVSAPEAK